MSADSMRHFLVMSAVCKQCGGPLTFSYDRPPPLAGYDPSRSDGITGAAKVEMVIVVAPCKKCYGEATAPLEALRAALKGVAT